MHDFGGRQNKANSASGKVRRVPGGWGSACPAGRVYWVHIHMGLNPTGKEPIMIGSRPTGRRTMSLVCLSLLLATIAWAQPVAVGGTDQPSYLKASDADVQWWREMKFGMFIHWGPVSLKGTEIGWSRGKECPTDGVRQLYKQFNPTQFDADAWVDVAKDAGHEVPGHHLEAPRRVLPVASKLTDYDIVNAL